jgi:tRNA pseudouridine38-40 synthase
LRCPIRTIVAGRTDAGVHATAQVIHVDVPESCDTDNLKFRLNQILDPDIRILKVSQPPVNFDARYSATSRHYRYKILDNNADLAPLERLDCATWFRPLDIDLMNQAAASILGKHDFLTFCRYREGATTLRTLLQLEWHRDERGFAICDVAADGFGWNMVRNLVGASVCVGEGRFPVSWMREILDGAARVSDSYVFPAHGLTLVGVTYPEGPILTPTPYQG